MITKVRLLPIPEVSLTEEDEEDGVFSEGLVVAGISAVVVKSVGIAAVVESEVDVVEDDEDCGSDGVAPGTIVHMPVCVVYSGTDKGDSDVSSGTAGGVVNDGPKVGVKGGGPGDGAVSILDVHAADRMPGGPVRQDPASC